jgi:UPF0042 nucleotide-binding protein
MRIVIVTGLSGAGKTTALRALEDIGFYCVDNLPLPLVPQLVSCLEGKNWSDVALSVDARQRDFLGGYREMVAELRTRNHLVEVLFLEAPDDVVLRRYSETRRRHPLAGDDLAEGIRRDRETLFQLRDGAAVLNTGGLTVHQIKGIIQERYGRGEGRLAVTLVSFGFKHGVPAEAELVFDVRFLPNPYFEAALSGSDGRQKEVADFVLGGEEGKQALTQIEQFLRYALPQFEREGKMYLTCAIGCTGGRHRSVAVIEELGRRLGTHWAVRVRHRDLERGT